MVFRSGREAPLLQSRYPSGAVFPLALPHHLGSFRHEPVNAGLVVANHEQALDGWSIRKFVKTVDRQS